METKTETIGERLKGLNPQVLLALIAVLLIAVIVLGVMMAQQSPQQSSQVVATVNGEEIMQDELFEALYAQGGKDALDQLITRRLILQESEQAGITVSEEDLDAEIDSIILESFQGSEEAFLSALDYYGISEESFREDARLNMLVRQIALEQINPTDEDVRAYFEENRDLFDQAEEVEARHILVESEELVNEIAAMLADGDDFAALAAVHSLDQSNKDSGGYLGFFSRGMMVEEFEEAAFALEVGEISEPVQTNFGFHLIELLGRKEASEVDFDTISEQVREALIEEQIPVVINTLVQTLYEKAEIEYMIGSESAEPDTGL